MPKTWTAEDINGLMRAYQPACVLGAAAELELFVPLAQRPQTAAELAKALGLDLRGTTMLLDALVALELLAKTGGHYAVAPGIADTLTPTGKHTVLAMTQHQMNCLRRWAQLARVVKTGQPAPREASIRGEAGDQQSFIEAMNDISGPVADTVVREVNVVPWTHVIDVGGGSGTWLLAWLEQNPKGTGTLFDLPHVIPMALARIGATPLASRVKLVAGDYMTDELPPGADLAWVSAIIHSLSREQNRQLFGKVHRVLKLGGHLMIRDIVMDEAHTQPVSGAMFAINMLTGNPGGTYALAEIREDLELAGFKDVRQIRQDAWMNAVVVARKE